MLRLMSSVLEPRPAFTSSSENVCNRQWRSNALPAMVSPRRTLPKGFVESSLTERYEPSRVYEAIGFSSYKWIG